MKYTDAYELIKNLILQGELGESGTRLISAQELSNKYGISFVNTLKILRQLKEEFYLVSISQKLYIANGKAKKRSDLRKKIGSSKKIGILATSLFNDYYARLTQILFETLTKLGYTPFIFLYQPELNNDLVGLKFFIQNECEAFITLSFSSLTDHLDIFNRYPLPHVIIGTNHKGLQNVSFVTSENKSISAYIAHHFIKNNYTDFIYIHSLDTTENDSRFEGFKLGLQQSNIPLDRLSVIKLEPSDFLWKNKLISNIKAPGNEGKIGIFCKHDILAFTVFNFLNNNGYEIPNHIGIVGYDNLPLAQSWAITSCSYSYNDISQQAINCLMDKIENDNAENKNIKIQTNLIVRQSSQPSTPPPPDIRR